MIDIKTLEIILSIAAVVIGCTWRLSSQIATVKTIAELARDELVAHSTSDNDRFQALARRMDDIAGGRHELRNMAG